MTVFFPPFHFCFLGRCTSTCTSLAFWQPSLYIRSAGKSLPHLKIFPPCHPRLRTRSSANLFTPTTMTKKTEVAYPSPTQSILQALSAWQSLKHQWTSRKGIQTTLLRKLCFRILFLAQNSVMRTKTWLLQTQNRIFSCGCWWMKINLNLSSAGRRKLREHCCY